MTRPIPPALSIGQPSAFILPPLAVEPLRVAMRNLNAVWLYHSPPLAQFLPVDDYATTGGVVLATYIFPVVPSADSLPYRFELAATAGAVVTRTYYESVDTTIPGAAYAAIGTVTGSTGASGHVVDGPYTIAAATKHLKIVLTTIAPIVVVPMAYCIYPEPTTIPASDTANSGFRAYDDGVLEGVAGAPLHKEFLDRCRRSSLAVWHDRKQNALSMVADSTSGDPATEVAAAYSVTLPQSRIMLAGYGSSVRLLCKAIALTAGPVVTDAITITLSGDTSATVRLDASSDIESATATVAPAGSGLSRYVDVAIEATGAGVADIQILAIMIWPEAF